jgi:phage gpG-like protein
MYAIDIKIDTKEFQQLLGVIKTEFTPNRSSNTQITNALKQKMEGYFRVGGQQADGGPKWKKLSPERVAAKTQNKNVILVETGRLRSSFVQKSSDKFAKVVNSVPYGVKHDEGIDTPERPIIPRNRNSMVTLVEKTYLGRLKKRLGIL